MNKSVVIGCCMLLGFGGCSRALKPPDLGGLYNQAASHADVLRNPVVVIPGILGSKLIDGHDGRIVWGAFGGGAVNPQRGAGPRVVALPMKPGAELSELRDSVVSDGVLDRARLNLILPVELKAYAQILASLGAGGYRDQLLAERGALNYGDQHFTCFQFDYDWRRDNVENARRLHHFLLEKKAYVERERAQRFGMTDTAVQFDIVAHSMGGLLTRYYLRYGTQDLPKDGSLPPLTWAGAKMVERVILVGTPNAGSAKAVHQLISGAEFSPILPAYEPAVIGTMPAVYQLLPRNRHAVVTTRSGEVVDLYDPQIWAHYGWGLANPSQDRMLKRILPEVQDRAERRRWALDHQAKCLERARRFAAALDVPAGPPQGVQLMLFAGDAVATVGRLEVDTRNGRVRTVGHPPGDGTVTRSSALMDERLGSKWSPDLRTPIEWSQVMFLFTDHLGLTMDPVFTDNVLFLLLERESRADHARHLKHHH